MRDIIYFMTTNPQFLLTGGGFDLIMFKLRYYSIFVFIYDLLINSTAM